MLELNMKNEKDNKNNTLNTSKNSNDSTKLITKSNNSSSDSNTSYQNNALNSSLNNSIIRNSDDTNTNYNRISSYAKSLYNSNKHGYKNDHNTIINNTDISDTLKEDYINYYNYIEGRLNELRKLNNNKEAFNKKLQPGMFSTPTKEEEDTSEKLTDEISKLESEKEQLKNELYLYQSIFLKNQEKISSLFGEKKVKYFNNGNIDYLDITDINSRSYETRQLLKEKKYKEIIENKLLIEYLKSSEIVDFLQYLAENNNTNSASNLFQNYEYIRIDIYNHFLHNEFWTGIYSQEQFQGYVDHFYQYAQNNNYPQIPYWGEVILSNNHDLVEENINNIVKNYLGDELVKTINKITTLIDNDAEITDNQYNLIYNLKNYLSGAQEAKQIDISVESRKKITSFIEKSCCDTNTLYDNINGISSIDNKDIYEYNSSFVKKINATVDSQTDLNALEFNTVFQYTIGKQKLNYEYYNAKLKKNNKKIIEEENKDKKEGNEKSGTDKASYFFSGVATTTIIGFELFLMWSTYSYWFTQRAVMKFIEKAKKDIDSLLQKDASLLPLIHQNKLKSIFSNLFDDETNDKKEDQEEDEEMIIFDKPIYQIDIEKKSTIIKTPEVDEELIAIPCYISMLGSHGTMHLPNIALPFLPNNPYIEHHGEVESHHSESVAIFI